MKLLACNKTWLSFTLYYFFIQIFNFFYNILMILEDTKRQLIKHGFYDKSDTHNITINNQKNMAIKQFHPTNKTWLRNLFCD